jgi:hypothetical protein
MFGNLFTVQPNGYLLFPDSAGSRNAVANPWFFSENHEKNKFTVNGFYIFEILRDDFKD